MSTALPDLLRRIVTACERAARQLDSLAAAHRQTGAACAEALRRIEAGEPFPRDAVLAMASNTSRSRLDFRDDLGLALASQAQAELILPAAPSAIADAPAPAAPTRKTRRQKDAVPDAPPAARSA